MTRPPHPPAAGNQPRVPWRLYALALLGLWLTRGVLVLSQADVFGYEEFAKAELGRAMLDGPDIEHHRLAYHYYEVGGFVVSHVDALFFALFGSSVLTLKAVALTWLSLMLVAFMALAGRAYGRCAAALAALVFVLAPASLQQLSLLVLGIHFQSLLFQAWILLQAGRIAVEGSTRRRDLLLLGLSCGLGTSFDLTTLAASACAALAVLVHARRSLREAGWAWLAGGALLGLLPYLWMAAQVGPAILDLHGETLGTGRSKGHFLERTAAFVRIVWGERSALDRLEMVVRAVVFAAGVALLLRGRDRRAAWSRIFLAHMAIFVAATMASGMAVGRITHFNEFERPAPLWLGFVLLSAGALDHMLASHARGVRAASAAAVALLALVGARAVVRTLGPVPPARWGESAVTLASTRACGLGERLIYLYDHLEGTPQERVALLGGMREPVRTRLEAQLGTAAIGRQHIGIAQALELTRSLGGERWRNYALGLGELLTREVGWDATRLPELLEPFDEPTRAVLFEAAARGPHFRQQLALVEEDVQLGLREGFPEAWHVGLGWRLSILHLETARVPYHRMRPVHPVYDPQAARAFIARQPEAARAALERGWLG
ncbi:MAG TPA: hypothetical protein VMT18_01480, partial [Planctomycetota bacterium]|nr:hypothetical protein [Planctomycetota bacterium]